MILSISTITSLLNKRSNCLSLPITPLFLFFPVNIVFLQAYLLLCFLFLHDEREYEHITIQWVVYKSILITGHSVKYASSPPITGIMLSFLYICAVFAMLMAEWCRRRITISDRTREVIENGELLVEISRDTKQ